MRQRNHCSSSKGIPKMKLQASEPSGPESLQSQTRPWPKKRLSISCLGVVHRRQEKPCATSLRAHGVAQAASCLHAIGSLHALFAYTSNGGHLPFDSDEYRSHSLLWRGFLPLPILGVVHPCLPTTLLLGWRPTRSNRMLRDRLSRVSARSVAPPLMSAAWLSAYQHQPHCGRGTQIGVATQERLQDSQQQQVKIIMIS